MAQTCARSQTRLERPTAHGSGDILRVWRCLATVVVHGRVLHLKLGGSDSFLRRCDVVVIRSLALHGDAVHAFDLAAVDSSIEASNSRRTTARLHRSLSPLFVKVDGLLLASVIVRSLFSRVGILHVDLGGVRGPPVGRQSMRIMQRRMLIFCFKSDAILFKGNRKVLPSMSRWAAIDDFAIAQSLMN